MNILVTGIHGFVGSNLVVALKERHSLYGLDIVAPEKEGVVKTFSWKDIEPASFPMRNLPEFDAIIHLAGKAHDTKNRSAAQAYFDINMGLTQKIFDFFLESSAKKFVFFSSVKAAADSVVGDMLTEDVVPAPVGPYGESKIAAENYILDKLKVENGKLKANPYDDKQVYILRPCMIHGPGNKGNLNLLYNVVRKGVPWPLGAFENRRSFTSIDNLCYVVEGLLTKEVASGIYHMGDDEALSTNELIALMCRALERKPHIWKINRGLMEFCARLGTLLHLPLNAERLRKLTENYVVSNAKIKAALGIDRMPVRAEEGIVRTIKSFSNIFPSTRASSLLLPKRRAFPAAMTMQPIFIGSHPFLVVICSYLFSPTRRRSIRPRAGICSTRIISSACAPCQAIPSRGHRLREPRDRKCTVIGARHKNLFP